MSKRKPQGPLQVLFICPRCGKKLAWALPSASISCPYCGTWVTDENRNKKDEIFLPIDSDQLVLFKEEKKSDNMAGGKSSKK